MTFWESITSLMEQSQDRKGRHMTAKPFSLGSTFLQELKSLKFILEHEFRTPTFKL